MHALRIESAGGANTALNLAKPQRKPEIKTTEKVVRIILKLADLQAELFQRAKIDMNAATTLINLINR